MSFWDTFLSPAESQSNSEINDVKYHLTKLFEAEASLTEIDSRLTEVNRSTLRFGIEDVQLLSASLDQTQLALKIESWIKNFEPRLTQLSVELVERKAGENSVSFSISATMNTQYGDKELIFDSTIALNDLSITLDEDSYD